MPLVELFDMLSPLDFRTLRKDRELVPFLSESGFIATKLQVELALVRVLARRGRCTPGVLSEVEAACPLVTTDEVYELEDRTGHDIRALVQSLRARLSDQAKPFVHLGATSFDVIDTARALMYREATYRVVFPRLRNLLSVLLTLAEREADTVQVGRTHGQHAVPITFGFGIAGYVNRLGDCVCHLDVCAGELRGKFSGAVGAGNAASLFFDDPRAFEREVLSELGFEPYRHSTQVAPPEAAMRLLFEYQLVAGVLANLADDMRHLARTEIDEVGEAVSEEQDGSSTMPHKINPINFENIKSVWKIVVGKLVTVLLDQISEHQRDLTNSASARTYGELIAYVAAATSRAARVMGKLRLNRQALERNLHLQKGLVMAEPLYLLLSALGHTDAHGKSKRLSRQALREGKTFTEVVYGDPELASYLGQFTGRQRELFKDPARYTGVAGTVTRDVCGYWRNRLGIAA